MSIKINRKEVILDYLKSNKVSTIKELAGYCSVSDMTIRRDISVLVENENVESFYGGVSLKHNNKQLSCDYLTESGRTERIEQKKRIAEKAVDLINENDVVLIDTGTTAGFMVNYLNIEMENIVYSYALNIINGVCAKPDIKLIACGGYFHSKSRMFASKEGVSLIKEATINKVFLSARGITKEIGITTCEPYKIELKKAAMSVSEQKILLADSTKFGKAWYAKYSDLSDIDIIITDDEIDNKYVEILENMNIKLYIV